MLSKMVCELLETPNQMVYMPGSKLAVSDTTQVLIFGRQHLRAAGNMIGDKPMQASAKPR